MKHFFFLTFIIFFNGFGNAQNKGNTNQNIINIQKQDYADIENAIPIHDSIVGPYNVSLGYGKTKTIFPGMQESNSIWFKFSVSRDTLLSFDIAPIDSLQDYDFAIFKYAKNKNGSNNLIKLRHCFSYCPSKSGLTGLSKYVKNTEIGAGNGPAYVSAFEAKANQIYYLMVDYGQIYLDPNYIKKVGNPNGFYIYFYNNFNRSKPIVLKNVLFENNKATLKNESFKELDLLALNIIKSAIVIEISGHTDNVGDANKNIELSMARAEAVKNYLVSKKVNPSIIFCKGYGGTQPIANNQTEQGRALNRRVEMKVLLN